MHVTLCSLLGMVVVHQVAATWQQPHAAATNRRQPGLSRPPQPLEESESVDSGPHSPTPAPSDAAVEWRQRRAASTGSDANGNLYGNNMRMFQILGHFSRNLNRRRLRNQQQQQTADFGGRSSSRSRLSAESNEISPAAPRSLESRSSLMASGARAHKLSVNMRPMFSDGGGVQSMALRAPAPEEDPGKRNFFLSNGWQPVVTPEPPRRWHRPQPEMLMMAPPGGPGVTSDEKDKLNGFAFTSTHWGPLGKRSESSSAEDEGWSWSGADPF